MARELTSVEEYRRLLAGVSTEEDLLVDVAQRLTLGRWRWHHIRRSDRAIQQGDPGFPDILAVRGDLLLVRELKGPTGRYETGQREWLEDLGRVTRVDVGTWRPSDLERLAEVLR